MQGHTSAEEPGSALDRQVPDAKVDLDFDEATLPWIDKENPDIEGYVKSLAELPGGYDLGEKLKSWHENGFVIFEGQIDLKRIDKYLEDFREVLAHGERYNVMVNHEVRGRVPIHKLSREDRGHPHLRVVNLHNLSVAGKRLALSEVVVSFLRHVFHEEVALMQTLTFHHGSEQKAHQDYAFVVSSNPSHLAASWLALEDVHPDAGPLGYYPGSHRIAKFDWGNGIFKTERSTKDGGQFAAHIVEQCEAMGLRREIFLPKKGDVFIWHGALCHLGMPRRNRDLTRLSVVSHFSSAPAYPRDRRKPEVVPKKEYYNGAFLYEDPNDLGDENLFPDDVPA